MGQYYVALLQDENGKKHIFNNGDSESYSIKLMEHSYWGNNFVLNDTPFLAGRSSNRENLYHQLPISSYLFLY